MYASFNQADLTRANFKDANLRGAVFHGSNWKDAINLADNPTFTEPTTRIASAQKLILQQQEAEDDEALPGDKNTCYAVIDLYDKNIDKYLAKDPGNFILKKGKNKECESLENLKQQYFSEVLNDYEGYYECSQSVIDWQNSLDMDNNPRHTKIAFNPEDYITDVEYVKVGSANHYIVKPKWFYAGPVPEPRMFNLVSTGKKKQLLSKRIATHYGTNVVSDVHCDPLDTFEIYRLKPVFLKTRTVRKTTKRTARKTTARKTTRKLRKVLHRQTKRRSLTAADETTAGGGRKRKTKKRKHKKIKHT